MKLIAVDLEMNMPSEKIIQIGAVCFDPSNGAFLESFDQLVNPGEAVTSYITDLTGINDSDLKGKPTIVSAAAEFSAFKGRLEASPIGVVWGSGNSNDVRRIFDESGVTNPFKTRIIDVKGTYQIFANASGSKFRNKVGLYSACKNLGLGWDSTYGKQHNALADAHNTFRLYMFLSKCLKGAIDIKLG
jgi:inhibitor of KinA sporulation pathway (predicted exonuclease)